MEIIKCENKKEAMEKAGEALASYLRENFNNKVLFLSSGGSSLSILDEVPAEVLSKNLTVTVLDTRFGVNLEDENFYQLTKTNFYEKALKNSVQFFNPINHSDVLENIRMIDIVDKFNSFIKKRLSENPRGKIIATVGMGEDGHIAGIFPMADKNSFKNLFEKENYAVGYETVVKNQFPKRITATCSFLSKADKIVSYIVGEQKRSKLLELSSVKEAPSYQFPAVILKRLNGVSVYTNITI